MAIDIDHAQLAPPPAIRFKIEIRQKYILKIYIAKAFLFSKVSDNSLHLEPLKLAHTMVFIFEGIH